MINLKRALTAIVVTALVAFVAFLTMRSGLLVWHEWHGSAGLRWLATIGLVCALTTVGVVVWMVIAMVRP